MRVHTAVILFRLLVFVALGVLGVFIFGVDPAALTVAGQTLFFVALWMLSTSAATLFLLTLARRFLSQSAFQGYLIGSVRQGALLGAWGTSLALAQFFGYLVWWFVLLALALILLIEFTVRQYSRP
ncbi:MAG: hypothetical protein E6Q06_03165 [Candidatus Moraniibacteriota bacterium]|nr:MAG: hypothetical protein E6Q06_03165 [Candidatus Moranbacteria bacterium]